VQTHGYVHVFGDQFDGETHRLEAVRSLGAQLVSRYQLPYSEIGLDLASSSTFLENVLKLASEQRTAGERIVIVCDALDQAGTPLHGVNPFGLPKFLPEGVFIIASQRPVTVRLDCEPAPAYEALKADDPDNQGDIHEYLTQAAQVAGIRGQLTARGV